MTADTGGRWSAARAGRRLLVGVVHLGPLPGAPRFGGSLERVVEAACADAVALAEGGCDALVVENYGDVPFFRGAVPPETVAALAVAARAVGQAAPGPALGINVLRNDARAALGVAAAVGARFVRVNVHTGAMLTDQGLIEGRAAETLRARARLCPDVAVLADVHVKHAAPLGGGAIEDAAQDALERGLADAVLVTGRATGAPPDAALVARVRARVGAAPLLIASGVTADSAAALLAEADGAIVGSALERGGRAGSPVELARVVALRRALDALPRR